MPINRARIREYLRQGEGAPPPVFVGHDDVLNDILVTAKDSAGQSKKTHVVQGAPGAGKTSLLHEMQKRWTGEDGFPRVVALHSTQLLYNSLNGVGAVLEAWTMDEGKWKRTLTDRIKRLSGIGIGPGGLSMEFSDVQIPETLYMVANRYPVKEQARPIIVAVDEAQRLSRGQTAPEALFLQEIHDGGSGLPLILVLAGLSDTDARAREMHLTRGRTVHEVRPLTQAQARDFMRRLALWFGLDTSRHNTRLEALADICDGWPRHLRFAGVSLAEEALRIDGDMHRMDWPAMAARTWQERQAYYNSQRTSRMRHAKALLAAVMQDIPTQANGPRSLEDTEVLASIVRHRRIGDTPDNIPWSLPKGMDAEDFLEDLVHQGALYIDGEGYVHSPIPSFKAFLINQGRQPDTEPTKRNDEGDDGTDFRA